MKLLRFSVIAAIACLSTALFGGCSDDDGIDNRDLDYGYVQFKLYKEASYDATRAVKPQLDYLSEASKVKVTLLFAETTIAQTLILSSADKETAEFGLRSDKLKLLTGSYQVITFALYDANDELIYNGTPENSILEVVAGGLTQHDLTVDVTPRGKVKFTLTKDLSDFTQTPDKTRAANRQYTFDEIAFVNLTVRKKITNEQTSFQMIPAKFSIHFDEDDDTYGYQTSSLRCDSLLSLKAGDYTISLYETYDKSKNLLETNRFPNQSPFTVEDNKTTEAKVSVTLYEADEYIKDYYALYQIWKALEGENWYYKGENYPEGINWDFNKDPDMWGAQPGVALHSNGRVAGISIGEFGFRGHLPAAIGQLTELVELYLGNHNDGNLLAYDPTIAPDKSLTELSRTRMERHKEYLRMTHYPTQLSEAMAFALKEHNIVIPETSLYEQYPAQEIIDPQTGRQMRFRPFDVVHGKLANGLKSIDPAIGKLEKLERLNIANGELESLPKEVANLKSCTDLEIYNCPKMTRFPVEIAQMPELISVNLSTNKQWSPEEAYKGLEALSTGASKEKIQILYMRDNSLKAVPATISNMKKLGLLDLASNRIELMPPLGKEINLVQLYLDNNELTTLTTADDGYFCGMDDMEIFSVTFNKLTKFPNIFTAKTKYVMKTVDFSDNEISGFEGEEDGTYNGIAVNTISIMRNKLKKFPVVFAKTNSQISQINLRGNGIDEIPEGSFDGKYSSYMTTIDIAFNRLKKFPKDFSAEKLPYLKGIDLGYNAFDKFPFEPLNCASLTAMDIRGQRDDQGNRCLKEWPKGIANHFGLRGLYIGSNDLRKIDDTISTLIYYLDISDNPNITFDASGICYAWQQGAYVLIYDKSQNILNCDKMLE